MIRTPIYALCAVAIGLIVLGPVNAWERERERGWGREHERGWDRDRFHREGWGPVIRGYAPGPFIDIAAPRLGLNVMVGSPGYPYPIYQPAPVVVPEFLPYQVLYRANYLSPWQVYQSYNSRHWAHESAERLRRQGFETMITN